MTRTTGATTRTEIFQPGKTLWDWLQLLIIPVVLAIADYLFNLTVSRNEQKSTQLRDQTERDISSDNQREAALQQYIDKMSELLLEKKLRESQPENEVRKIARVRTLTILPHLDAVRKSSILLFLHESSLIENGKSIIDLKDANLRGANLSGDRLNNADLSSTYLNDADLSGTDLSYANLSYADLRDAKLISTNLNYATLISTNLNGTSLEYINLNNTNLSFILLSNATLSFINLNDTDLSYADLSGTYLNHVALIDANLSGADLSGADLSDAKVTLSQLDKTRSLHNTIMPDKSKHP